MEQVWRDIGIKHWIKTIKEIIEKESESHLESAHRDEVVRLLSWCRENNLLLNTSKTKEPVMDFRRTKIEIFPLIIGRDRVKRVLTSVSLESTKRTTCPGLWTLLSWWKRPNRDCTSWGFLGKENVSQRLLMSFYRAAVESILACCIFIWYNSCAVAQRKALPEGH